MYVWNTDRMKVYRNINDVEYNLKRAVTVGTFDGLHLGHHHILDAMLDSSKTDSLSTFVITFDPHPQVVLKKHVDDDFRILTTAEEKIQLLDNYGIDECLLVKFDTEFSNIKPLDFINAVFSKIGFSAYIIGYDHHFGKNREGNEALVKSLMNKDHFQLRKVEAYLDDGMVVSSTNIRKLLKAAQICEANKFLGYDYSVQGKVVKGDGRGRTLGFPTANIRLLDANKLMPGNGVYLVKGTIQNTVYYGMANIGIRPTFTNDSQVGLEVYFFDYKGDLYNQIISISFLEFIRSERKFDGMQSFISQLHIDEDKCKSLINNF